MSSFVLPELIAMQQIANAVADLTPTERRRVGMWLVEYAQQNAAVAASREPNTLEPAGELSMTATVKDEPKAHAPVAHAHTPEPKYQDYTTFAKLYATASPEKGAQKAAVAGYWLQTKQGKKSWEASEINRLLKSIGVKVSSISIVLTNAVKAASPLITELARLGESERSRRTFCLSEQGIAYVESRIG